MERGTQKQKNPQHKHSALCSFEKEQHYDTRTCFALFRRDVPGGRRLRFRAQGAADGEVRRDARHVQLQLHGKFSENRKSLLVSILFHKETRLRKRKISTIASSLTFLFSSWVRHLH